MDKIDELFALVSSFIARFDTDKESAEPYGEYLLRWYATYKKPYNGKNTSDYMYYYISERISPALGNVPLNKLSGDKIQIFLNDIKGNNTRKKIAMIINGSLIKAVKLRYIKYNPFDAVELPTYKKKHYRALSLSEQTLIYGYIKNKLYKSVFVVLVCTGMRIGEFLAIDKDCIDRKQRMINVFRSVDIRSDELQNRTKTYSSVRRIPYVENLTSHLNEILRYKARSGDITYSGVRSYFRRLYATLSLKGINLHSFRHTFGCMCYRAGISDKMIQHLMGHAALDVTMNVYVDVLGTGRSEFEKYFEEYKKDLEKRPADFWVFFSPEK